MYLNNTFRSKLKLKAIHTIKVELYHDKDPRDIQTPQYLLDAMKKESNYSHIYKNWM